MAIAYRGGVAKMSLAYLAISNHRSWRENIMVAQRHLMQSRPASARRLIMYRRSWRNGNNESRRGVERNTLSYGLAAACIGNNVGRKTQMA